MLAIKGIGAMPASSQPPSCCNKGLTPSIGPLSDFEWFLHAINLFEIFTSSWANLKHSMSLIFDPCLILALAFSQWRIIAQRLS